MFSFDIFLLLCLVKTNHSFCAGKIDAQFGGRNGRRFRAWLPTNANNQIDSEAEFLHM